MPEPPLLPRPGRGRATQLAWLALQLPLYFVGMALGCTPAGWLSEISPILGMFPGIPIIIFCAVALPALATCAVNRCLDAASRSRRPQLRFDRGDAAVERRLAREARRALRRKHPRDPGARRQLRGEPAGQERIGRPADPAR